MSFGVKKDGSRPASLGSWQTFYACMDMSGRITVPKLIRNNVSERQDERQRVTGAVLEVQIEPA